METKLKYLLVILSMTLVAVSAGAFLLESSVASRYYLFEFIGVLAASIITVFGLMKMRDLT